MSQNTNLSTSLSKNIEILHTLLPLEKSYDFVTKEMVLGGTSCFFLSVNGLSDLDTILKIFSEVGDINFKEKVPAKSAKLPDLIKDHFLYAQISYSDSFQEILLQVLSGPSVLFLDGYSQAMIIDARQYPDRGIDSPETERVIRGAKDSFVENLQSNCNLLRRRLRACDFIFEMHHLGTVSHTDVVIAYLDNCCDHSLLKQIKQALNSIDTSCLTMGISSLKELLLKKSIFHPLPSFYLTERPDVACSYLTEGYILLLVDNSPFAIVLPCTIFQFTQSPEDYYKSPIVGTYLRGIRFFCIIISLFFMPLFLYFSFHPDFFPSVLQGMLSTDTSRIALFIYVLFVELGLDIFKYASAHSSDGFSGAFAIVGGLLIGDMAINLEWTNNEVIFYGAATLLASLGIPSIELSDGIKLYRLLLVLLVGFFPNWGLFVGLTLIFLSLCTTPVFGKKSYFWPLFPFHWNSLKTLLFRYPTFKAQPENQKSPE